MKIAKKSGYNLKGYEIQAAIIILDEIENKVYTFVQRVGLSCDSAAWIENRELARRLEPRFMLFLFESFTSFLQNFSKISRKKSATLIMSNLSFGPRSNILLFFLVPLG